MIVITTAPSGKSLPKVIVTLAASELDALLAGGAERFPVTIGQTTHDVEMIAQSAEPPPGPKPNIRLRVADGALSGARADTVTVFFENVPFQLVLMCSDPHSSPSQHAQPRRDEGELPLAQRLMIGGLLGAIVAGAGYLRDDPLFYLVAIGVVGWSIFGKTNPTR